MGSCRQTATEEPYSIFWRLYPRLFDSTCVNVSPCTLDRPVARLVTPAGSCTALSMESSLTVTCPPTRPSETLSPRMSTLPSPPSRPRGASSSWTGVQLDSRLESTTSPQLLCPEGTWPRWPELSACSPTQLPLPRPGPG